MSKKVETSKEVELLQNVLTEEYNEYFLNLLYNQLNIKGLPDDEPSDYVLDALFEKGYVGRIILDDKEYLVNADVVGNRNKFGKPLFYQVIWANGQMIRKRFALHKDIEIIRLNPRCYSFKWWLYHKAEEMARVDIAIQNNLEASSLGFIVETEGNEVSVREAIRKGRNGDFCIIKRNNTDLFKITPLNQNYIGHELLEHKKKIQNEVFARLGIVAGVSDKRERVQSYDLPIDVAIDSVYTIIDTFNNDCKKYNVNMSMELNGAIEELYNHDNINNESESENDDNSRNS